VALLLDEPPVAIQRSLVRAVGIMEAAVVQQLHYWLQRATKRGSDGRPWVYKTYAEWGDEIGISAKQARGALDRLRTSGVILSRQNPHRPEDRTLWWTVDYLALEAICPNGQRASAPEGRPSAPEGSSRARVPGSSSPETTPERTSPAELTLVPPPDSSKTDSVREVFEHWQRVMSKPRSKLTDDRRRKISARLKDYTVADLMKAIDGCARSPWHLGENDARREYNDLELICRSGAKVEQFMEMAGKSRASDRPPQYGEPGYREWLRQRDAEKLASVQAGLGG